MHKKKSKFWYKRAQTITELAVFGAILIYMLGVIVKQSLSSSYLQNQNLMAMRAAMRYSYGSSFGMQNSARNYASILVIEDRLTAESGKHASIDRVPQIASGSATFSRNLFMPILGVDKPSEPIFDMFINGKHFPFRVAAIRSVDLSETPVIPRDNKYWYWKPACAKNNNSSVGCPMLLKRVYNHATSIEWCVGGAEQLGGCSTKFPLNTQEQGFTEDDRFDLFQDGVTVDPGIREEFGWQWAPVFAYDEGFDLTYNPYAPTFNELADVLFDEGSGIVVNDPENPGDMPDRNRVLDVDGDFKEETILEINKHYVDDNLGGITPVITELTVMDQNDGVDLDFTYNSKDYQDYINGVDGAKPKPGLTKDVQMMTYVQDGTMLVLEEGNLYSNGQWVRQTQAKDQVDVISRVIRLSNDTERFCKGGEVNIDFKNSFYKNPVEACETDLAACMSSENIDKTCMYINKENNDYRIFVRSRVADRRGRKWITDISDDSYIKFTAK